MKDGWIWMASFIALYLNGWMGAAGCYNMVLLTTRHQTGRQGTVRLHGWMTISYHSGYQPAQNVATCLSTVQ